MKDEALKLALEALLINCGGNTEGIGKEAITAIKQALKQPVQEPVAWKWHQAPVKTSWGHEMVVTDLAIDKDKTVSVYCERDQTAKVEAMFNPPAAIKQALAAPVQEHVGNWIWSWLMDWCKRNGIAPATQDSLFAMVKDARNKFESISPAAQRQWVGLTVEEFDEIHENNFTIPDAMVDTISKLKEKNL